MQDSMNNKKGSTLPGFGIAVIWGLTFLSIKVAIQEFQPMTLALMRFIMATALVPCIALLTRTSIKVALRDLPILAASGFVGISLYFFFENNGILRLSASESSLIVGTIPVLTLLTEMLLYREKPRTKVVLGILLSFLGVALIVLRSESARSSSFAGYLYMAGAAVSWVVYSFLTKPVSNKYPLLSITFWQIFFGTLGCLPFALLENKSMVHISGAAWLNVVFLGVFGSAIGYWLYVIMLDNLGASRSSVFINLIPVVSVIASFFVLGERLATLQLLGGAAALAGVYLATDRT